MDPYESAAPYLAVYRALPAAASKRGLRLWLDRRFLLDWKKIALLVLAGGLVGGSFVLSHKTSTRSSPGLTRVDPNEVARLEIRNRRLEALVWALRHRETKAARSR